MQLSLVFSDVTKIADSWWKMLMSTKLEGCVTWYIIFLDAGHPLSHFLSQFCPSCSISQEPYIICMVHMCKMIISPSGFFIFSKCWFFGLLEGSGRGWGKVHKMIQYEKRSVCHGPYLRIHLSYDSMFLSCHVRVSEWIHTLYLPGC